MAADRALKGALAGAAAAAVWALQQPLDRRVFGVPVDDVDLLAGLVLGDRAPSRARRPIGLALHLVNGAAFGAVYASAAPRLPLPAWARGAAVALAEHVAAWPLVAVVERARPDEVPRLWSSPRALAQSTWRRLLFGVVLGELERRLNPPLGDEPSVPDEVEASSNGHGTIAAIAAMVPQR